MKTKDKKLLTYFIINLTIILSTTLGICWAFFSGNHLNPNTFLFYTTQSNIFVLVLAIIFAKKQCNELKGKQQTYSNTLMTTKFIATVAITITIMVYTGLLLPDLIAKGEMHRFFTVNNFTLHYITPILSIVSFFVFDKNYSPKNKHSLLTAIAPFAYFVFAILLSLIPGEGFFGTDLQKSKFPYFFLDYQANSWFGLSGGIFKLGVFWWVLILFVVISALSFGFITLFKLAHKQNKIETKQQLVIEPELQEIQEEN